MSRTIVRHATSTELARVARMADALSAPGGAFYVDPRTGDDVTSGYRVPLTEDRRQALGGQVSPADVRSYVYRNADVLAMPGVVVHGYRNPRTGVAYLDVFVVVESRATAAALCELSELDITYRPVNA